MRRGILRPGPVCRVYDAQLSRPSDVKFGLMRMAAAFGSGFNVETRVFRDEEAALEWLDVTLPPDSEPVVRRRAVRSEQACRRARAVACRIRSSARTLPPTRSVTREDARHGVSPRRRPLAWGYRSRDVVSSLEEARVTRMFVRHPVADFAVWKQAYDDFDQERKGWSTNGA
jgi:hypothetical protein